MFPREGKHSSSSKPSDSKEKTGQKTADCEKEYTTSIGEDEKENRGQATACEAQDEYVPPHDNDYEASDRNPKVTTIFQCGVPAGMSLNIQ